MLIGQAEEVLCPQGHTALQRHAEGEGEGDGLLCMSLPQSPLLFSSHYISIPLSIFLLAILAHCTDCTIYFTLHYPHTHKHKYSIFALSTQAHEHYLSALFALLSSWTSTLTQSMHTVIWGQSYPVSVYTPLPVNMFSLGVLFFYCDLCMYVC